MQYGPPPVQIAKRFIVLAFLGTGFACAPKSVKPPPPLPDPPKYTAVEHPTGYTLGDLDAIFQSGEAPQAEDLEACDREFRHLEESTDSVDEIRFGARELVREYPVVYHWCFYWKLRALHKDLAYKTYLDEKQEHVLKTYSFLTPIARAFKVEYHDPRYWRWAITQYRVLSEQVFYRKVEPKPQTTAEIMRTVDNPYQQYRQSEKSRSVVKKYGLHGESPDETNQGPETLPFPEEVDLDAKAPTQPKGTKTQASTKPGKPTKVDRLTEDDLSDLEELEQAESQPPSQRRPAASEPEPIEIKGKPKKN